jgi:hypothetical protein
MRPSDASVDPTEARNDVAIQMDGSDTTRRAADVAVPLRMGRKVRLLPAGGPSQIVKKLVRGQSDLP